MSNDVKTPNRIDSNTRKAMLYFLEFTSIEKFQDNKTQMGIKNAVNKTNNKLKPSIPNVSFILKNGIHATCWNNCKETEVVSKTQNKRIE